MSRVLCSNVEFLDDNALEIRKFFRRFVNTRCLSTMGLILRNPFAFKSSMHLCPCITILNAKTSKFDSVLIA